MDTVWCIMKVIDGVHYTVMIHRTHEKALESVDDLIDKGVGGLWIENKTLHN